MNYKMKVLTFLRHLSGYQSETPNTKVPESIMGGGQGSGSSSHPKENICGQFHLDIWGWESYKGEN